MRMRIGLDARYVYDHFPGIGRYVVNLAHALAEGAPQHTLYVLHTAALRNTRHDLAQLRRYANVRMFDVGVRPFSLLEHLRIPHMARILRLDVLHSPYYIKPYIGLPCPSVVTLYDLIGRRYPRLLPLHGRVLADVATRLALLSSQHIIAISRHTRSDLAHDYRVPLERITVTPLAADSRFVPQPADAVAAVRARYELPPRYLLYLGANKPHKNLLRLLEAWQQVAAQVDDAVLVLAGHHDPRYTEVGQFIDTHRLHARVRRVADVREEDVPALYSGAEVFVFPSLYEGFGLPPLEAMACGTPVLCSHSSSLPEVVDTAALLVDPTRVAELASGMLLLLTTPALQAQLRERGLHRAKTFSWERTARETLAVYEAAVAARHTKSA